jgi:hypothetical protein
LITSLFSWNFDLFIHSIAIGFLFNTIFGVDVVMMGLLLGVFGRRINIKSSYIPYFLLNIGLFLRFVYDLGLNLFITYLTAPMLGLGIISFFSNTFYQSINQIRKPI